MNKYHYRSIGLTCASVAFSLFADYIASQEINTVLHIVGLLLIIGAIVELIAAQDKTP